MSTTIFTPLGVVEPIQSTKKSPIEVKTLEVKTLEVELSTGESSDACSVSIADEVASYVESTSGDSKLGSSGYDDLACIVGIGCRLPGGIRSPSDLWDLLAAKKTTQGRVPAGRFNIAGYYHPDGKRAGAMDADGGYFLDEDVRQFDNSVFGINNLEATYMDPQQRKLLEVTYECLESAGLSMEDVSGTDTAVYIGNFTVDYQTMQTRDPDYLHRYSATGSGTAIMANRISHVFNLTGPSFTLDTACSSSIYGLHNAVMALKNGDCSAAIVAGANLITSIEQHLGTMKGGVLSPTSTCHTFDASADGYGRGEAVNAVLIKPLSRAIRDGDNVRAIIRGTAINANGRTNGITQPSARFQEAVIRKAYANAGLNMADTDYVECHGTGTAVGDPVEIEGIGRCFSPRYGPPLMIGAIKTNVGHSEAASGLSAVIKAVLAFEKGQIPPTYGITKLNPKLQLDKYNLQVVDGLSEWPRELRRASINSFGYGGANAHVILEDPKSFLKGKSHIESFGEFDTATEERNSQQSDDVYLFPISARSKWSLEKRIEQVKDYVNSVSTTNELSSIAFTLGEHRAHLSHRAFIIANHGRAEDAVMASGKDIDALPLAFVFTGQGAQYPGMGKELLKREAVFRDSIKELDAVLQAIPWRDQRPSWTLEQTILDPPETSMIHDVTRSQPVCTAIQIALVDLLDSWGIQAESVVGHSSGEIAAAYAAGHLSAAQAIQVAYFRGAAVGKLENRGAMLAAGLTPDAAHELIQELDLAGRVCVACVNAPESITLSGEFAAIDLVKKTLEKRGAFSRALQTGGRAYHSHMMTEVGALYQEMLEIMFSFQQHDSTNPHRAKMYSSVGQKEEDLAVFGADSDRKTCAARYWRQNLESTVQFSGALSSLTAERKMRVIEIGPHAALKGPIEMIRKKTGHHFHYSPSLVRDQDSHKCSKKLAGDLFIHGYSLEWDSINTALCGIKPPLSTLPPYPWDYSGPLLWSEPRASIEQRNRKHLRHELLGVLQTAGNGIDWAWRNLLRLSEVPWMRDHKLDSQIVFPATGYLGLTIEAVCQVCDITPSTPGMAFEFLNVSIGTAMVVPEETNSQIEIHTSLSARKLSTVNQSAIWYDFAVSSWDDGKPTLHCSGSIRLLAGNNLQAPSDTVTVNNTQAYESWHMGKWYSKLAHEGLCFGEKFQSITGMRTDGNRRRPEAISTTKVFQNVSEDSKSGTKYTLHPLVTDALLQAGIFGGTAGDVRSLRAYLPVFIQSCRIYTPNFGETEAIIHSRTRTAGFATKQVDGTLRGSITGECLVDMRNVRLTLYNGKTSSDTTPYAEEGSMKRQPCLDVQWKPDILRLLPESIDEIRQYIEQKVNAMPDDLRDHPSMAAIVALVDLASFKNPKMRVIELAQDSQCRVKRWLETLEAETSFPRCRSWVGGQLTNGDLQHTDENDGSFDTLIIPELSASTSYVEDEVTWLSSIFETRQGGVVIIRKTRTSLDILRSLGFTAMDVGQGVILAVQPPPVQNLSGRDVVLITPFVPSLLTQQLSQRLTQHLKEMPVFDRDIKIATLEELENSDMSSTSIYISLLELENEFLATMSPMKMDLLRRITDIANNLVWLTGAGMLSSSPDPNLTLSQGLSRALMLEQPSLRFTVVDVGGLASENRSFEKSFSLNLIQALASVSDMDDKEFIEKDGMLYISRFIAISEFNSLFRRRLDNKEPITKLLFDKIGPARLGIGSVGQMDTLHLVQETQPLSKPPPGFVDIRTKAVSLNAKDVYTASGRVETRTGTAAIEFSGVVVAVGDHVSYLKPGDHAVVLAPNRFATIERVPAWAAHKMLPSEDFCVMPTLPVIYGTALYALHDRAHLRAGESILIHSGAGAFGMATIALAQRIGAVVYTTVGSAAKKDYLMRELALSAENIFNSRDSSFVDGVRAATNGRGVDVIINSLVGDLMHDSWDCIADFGRFVEVGKRELVDAGKLDMRVFLRNCTFTAFDLTELFFHESQFYRDIWINKTKEALELYRSGQVKPVPIATFDISKISQAYRFFSGRNRIGKVVVSLENPQSLIPVMPSRYSTILNPEKTYLLIGCLGGLGRSISRWMVSRGARNFVFLGRSGCDRPEAQELVSRLQGAGANVEVVRGDVSNQEDVNAAVNACAGRPIGGVVQAAMGLSEALFTRMPHAAWHKAIEPKWRGSWNLHRALELNGHDADLDFFLLTSSVSGSVGTATESNYCAANGFLDAFARYRQSQGKPAVSVGLGMISEVGYLHENPDIEALLLRKGIQPLNEDEFLNVVDMALAAETRVSHVLTGLEPFGLRELIKKGFEVENGTTQDPRAGFLAAELLASQDTNNNNLPPLPQDQIDDHKALPHYGVDSMIAAEYRTWFWSVFKVDVPFLDIVSPKKSLDMFATFIEERLLDAGSGKDNL
uniref:Carrier domain-containing protein n=1 Tax=Bionectria ochroleuca TaxID=29856 RepID=A0A8H7NCH8_BIOOC